MSCDALWEEYIDLNPYQYSGNNPIGFYDDDGMKLKPPKSRYENINYKTMIFNDIVKKSPYGKKVVNYLNKQIDIKIYRDPWLPGLNGYCDVRAVCSIDNNGKVLSAEVKEVNIYLDETSMKGDYNTILLAFLEELCHAYQAFTNTKRWVNLHAKAERLGTDYEKQPLEIEAKNNARKIFDEMQEFSKLPK